MLDSEGDHRYKWDTCLLNVASAIALRERNPWIIPRAKSSR